MKIEQQKNEDSISITLETSIGSTCLQFVSDKPNITEDDWINDCLQIKDLLIQAYNAGKNGERLEVNEKVI